MKWRPGSLDFVFFFLAATLFFAAHGVRAQTRGGFQTSEPARASGLPGKVAGMVRRVDDGAALRKVIVTLAPESREMEAMAVRTDANGQFLFPEVPSGRYRVRVQRNGYVGQLFGQRGGGPGLALTVEPGQTLEKIDFRLERAGVLSGMVIDEDNEPIEGVEVRAMRVRFLAGGRERLVIARTARTDDLGNYRIPSLTPGMYYVQAGGRGEGVRIGGPTAAVGYGATFYPGVPTREQAQLVQVTSGNETSRIELALRSTPTYSIYGVIADAKSGGGMRRYNVGFASGGGTAFTNVDRDDGTFVMRGLEPGDYNLIAQVWDTAGVPRSGFRSVRISNADVQVVIEMGAVSMVQGEVRADDGKPMNFSGMMVSLQATDDRGVSPSGVIDEKGHFAVSNVPAGTYSVTLATRERDLYLKEARCRGQDAQASQLSLGAAEILDNCSLVVARDAGKVMGTVKQDDKPTEGMTVVLIPVEMERRKIARHTSIGQSDANGVFELRNVIPGEYFAFAVLAADDAPYFQLEYAERNRDSAVRITVKPGELRSVDLKVAKAQ
ncbi:MAG: carboxypeptidase-like regulatory domain-containing protein [Acidobacteria bacterium]|nr:carboxypeptidase-like regulatory domain-containing protein [Acidobacteriota bacterium]MCL5287905.1 carboxypeptidase-like regulatory domain-containing protein [Acidobacteriota bacterium]